MPFTHRTALDRYVDALLIARHDFRTVFIWGGLNETAQVVLRQVPSLLNEIATNDTGEPALQFVHNIIVDHATLEKLMGCFRPSLTEGLKS